MTKISQLSDIGTGLAAGDEFVIRDVSDASTPNKKVTASGFMDYVISQSASGNFSTISAGTGPLARVQTTFSGATGTITFGTSSAGSLLERARIDSSGRLLVGTSSSLSVASGERTVQIEGTAASSLSMIQHSASVGAAPLIVLGRSKGTSNGSTTAVANGDYLGYIQFVGANGSNFSNVGAEISAVVDGTVSGGGANDMPSRLVFSTAADGASSPTERMRISQAGFLSVGTVTSFTDGHRIQHPAQAQGVLNLSITNTSQFYACAGAGGNAAATGINVAFNNTTSRSINAGGTINASGADYAEYMVKAGDFTICKGDICGITADGFLTLDYEDAVSFVVKSTNPSYVGGDTWGNEDAVGPRPDVEDADALARWEAELETARQKVDRIAFAGQVPVNVVGATPGQYIVPVEAADGGIEGIAKNETDLTLAEYMRAVGKVIAIEDDGRARIIIKVA